MALNRNQILAIIITTLAVLMASTAQLNDLFGPKETKIIISAAGLLNGILSGILAIITGQAGMVRDVAAMPGVDSIKVNAQASQVLAAVATDPEQPKVGGTTDQVQNILKESAKG